MTAFNAPVTDILFSLEHVARAGSLPDWDAETAREVLSHFAAFAEGVLAPLDEVGDRIGARVVDGRVRMPDGFHEAYRQLAEGGWQGLTAPEAHGGMEMDALMLAAVSEVFAGANHSFQMVTGLAPGMIRTLMQHGSEGQRDTWIPRIASGEMLATMCLTESGAGSDLSVVRTRAEPDPDGWRLTGEKIFISGGDQDLSDGILHLVLARSGAPEHGTRGLSLFLCPSELPDGSRNGVQVERIEEKMGLHASPTCQLVFSGARAELVGREGEGLRAMFTMMNHARLDVGLQGAAHAARAADISRRYAAERTQGRGPDGAPVTIDRHADVARMLDEQDAAALGARAMCHMTLVALESGAAPELVEFLTPVCKYGCTEVGIRAADLAVQTLGGYGYLSEYRADQNYRDARITSIYEGTNGIHALTLATRLMRVGNGVSVAAFRDFVEAELAEAPHLSGLYALWKEGQQAITAMENPAPAAEAFMRLTALMVFQIAWARIASVADRHPEPERLRRIAGRVAQDGAAMAPAWLAMLRSAA